MKSKYFFQEFGKNIKDEHIKYETHQESTELSTKRCDHKNKVEIVNGILKCKCGAAWSGSQVETLYKLLTDNV